MNENRLKTMESKLSQCKQAYKHAISYKKEFYLCRDKLSVRQKSEEELKPIINTLRIDNKQIQNKLTSKNAENEDLRNRIRQLQYEKTKIQSDLSKNEREAASKLRDLTNENKKLRNSIKQRAAKSNTILPNRKALYFLKMLLIDKK